MDGAIASGKRAGKEVLEGLERGKEEDVTPYVTAERHALSSETQAVYSDQVLASYREATSDLIHRSPPSSRLCCLCTALMIAVVVAAGMAAAVWVERS